MARMAAAVDVRRRGGENASISSNLQALLGNLPNHCHLSVTSVEE